MQIDGTVVAEKPNPAVPLDVLQKIYLWLSHDITFDDIIDRLRPHTVPSGYTYSSWKTGTYYNYIIITFHLALIKCR